MGAKRTPLWDNLKFMLIFLVVLGHLADYYTPESRYMRMMFLFIYSFHMPAFIFISGMFCKKTVNNKNYQRIFSYFVLYVLIKMIHWLARYIFNKETAFSLLSESGIPWYAFALFAFSLMTIFLKKFNPKYVLVFSVAVALFSGYDNGLGDKLMLMRIVNFYPFFFAGYIADKEKLVVPLKKKPVKIIAAVIMTALLLLVIFKEKKLYDLRPLLTGKNSYMTMKDYLMRRGILLRLAYYAVSSLLVCCLISLTPEREFFFTPMGARTVQAYAVHCFLIKAYGALISRHITGPLGMGSIWLPLILIPIALVITLICSPKIFEKPFNFLLSPGVNPQQEAGENG